MSLSLDLDLNLIFPPLHDRQTGIGAALNVPAALSLIVEWFPDPEEQNMAIALFGGGGGIGNST